MLIPKIPAIRSKALRDSAKGEDCTLRIPGVCQFDPETTVLAHLPFGGRGTGYKASDLHAVYACAACHDELDGRARNPISREELLECCIRALAETHQRMTYKGLINVKGAA